jgi:hypothetical protein
MPEKHSGLKKIESKRQDLSDYVIHFTKGVNADRTLLDIISDKKLKDINDRGYICFTEAPLPALLEMFEHFEQYPNPMYSPYGIAIPKERFFKDGGRHVIYSHKDEKVLFDPSIHWRFEPYSPSRNFSWLREWRINISEYEIDPEFDFLITKSKDWENDLSFEQGDIIQETYEADGYFESEFFSEHYKLWKAVSIDSILKLSIKSNELLYQYIDQQIVGTKTWVNHGKVDPRAEDIRNETYFDSLKEEDINFDDLPF